MEEVNEADKAYPMIIIRYEMIYHQTIQVNKIIEDVLLNYLVSSAPILFILNPKLG